MLKKLLAAVGTIALALGLVALAVAPASAHTFKVNATCQTGVSVNLSNYNAGQSNTVKVVVDGATKTDQSFGDSFVKSYPFAGGQASYTYQVVVHAWDDQKYSFDTGVVTVSGCETAITAAKPGSTDAVCVSAGTVGGGGYTIPTAQVGVQYQRFDAVSNSWIAVGSGTYAASVGSVIKIRAVATGGYKLTGTTSWTFTICAPEASSCVVPTAPTVSYAICTTTPGSATIAHYTVPTASTGLAYYLQGSSTPLKAGTVTVTTFPTTVVIVAKATNGYTFPAKTVTSWTFTFTSAGDCLGNSIAVVPSFTPAVCTTTPGQSTDNSYTIFATTGAHFQVKIGSAAFVDTLPGTYSLGTGAASVTIVALPDAHYQLNGQTSFSHDFSAAPDCLKTVVPIATSTAAVCDTAHPGPQASGSYTLTAVTGVIYTVSLNGAAAQVVGAGTHPVSNGDDVVIKAAADTAGGYRVDGSPSWHFTYPSAGAGDCLDTTTTGTVTFAESTCDVDHPGTQTAGSYTIVAAAHVSYQVSVSSIGNGVYKPVTAGTHPAQPGDVVTVLVVPDAGYKIAPPIVAADFTHTFLASNQCLKDTKAVEPAATSEVCFSDGTSTSHLDGSITIPNTEGVQYFIDGTAHAAGVVTLPVGTYQVTAAAKTGYQLAADYPADGWPEVLASDDTCGQLVTHPLVDPAATQVQLQCFAAGSYTLGNDLSDPAAIIWTVNGSTVAQGTYKISAPGTVTVHAEANGPTYGLEQGATQDWTFNFATPTTCDLKTLALTGSSPTGWIVLGYILLISGLVLVAIRHARRRGTQG